MARRNFIAAILVIGSALAPRTTVRAQDTRAAQTRTAATSRATSRAAEGMRISIAEVKGRVQARADEHRKWEMAKEGTDWGEGAELRTAPRSSGLAATPPDQAIPLDLRAITKVN